MRQSATDSRRQLLPSWRKRETLIAAAVLYALASGSVRGFAMTLALGIVLSMFSAMVVSRLLVNSLYGMGLKDAKYYGTKKERKGFPFVEKEKRSSSRSPAFCCLPFRPA